MAHRFLGKYAETLTSTVAPFGDAPIREADLPHDPAPTLPECSNDRVFLTVTIQVEEKTPFLVWRGTVKVFSPLCQRA